jgi:hypothetical protein
LKIKEKLKIMIGCGPFNKPKTMDISSLVGKLMHEVFL